MTGCCHQSASYGAVLDALATNANRPTVLAANQLGLDLFYYYSPPRKLTAGWLNILPAAVQTYSKSLATQKPVMAIRCGDKVPLKFRWAREIEVAVIIAWPDARVWARKGILESRRTSDQMAFVCATGLDLPVADRRVSVVRRQHAIAVAIATVAASCQLPFPDYPWSTDSRGRTARDLAREAGLAQFLINWR